MRASVMDRRVANFTKWEKQRAVLYKGCGSNYDEGWLDDICTGRRGEDE